MNKRRGPVANITKEDFVAAGLDIPQGLALLYEMLSCIDSKVKLAADKLGSCPDDCRKCFDNRYLKRIHAIAGVGSVIILGAGYLLGARLLSWLDLLELAK